MVPRPTSLLIPMAPPDCLMKPYTMMRPRPLPFPTSLVVKKGSNTLASTSAGMPVPVGAGKPVSAIAIDPTGNTSEFSADSAFAFSSPVNLAVVLSQVASPIGTGQPFTYTATVTNNGTNTANNISLVCAAFGGGVQVDAAKTTINQGTISVETGGIYATIGSLAPGISAKATITATATQSGQINLTGLTYSSEPETTTTDNSTHEVVTVAAAPDLVVQGSGPSSVAINQPATFTFTVRNSGSGAASGVKLTIPLPTGSSYSNGTTSQHQQQQHVRLLILLLILVL